MQYYRVKLWLSLCSGEFMMTALRCISAATKATKTCRLPRKMLLAIETKEFKCQGGALNTLINKVNL